MIATCTHRVQHQHGTQTGYRCGCRCDDCTAALRVAAKRRNLRAAEGRPTLVDGAPVVAHVERLMSAGLSRRQVAHAAGVTESTLAALMIGKTRRIHRERAAALLAVRLPVTPIGVQRRARALIAAGWTRADLARILGLTPRRVASYLSDTVPGIVWPVTVDRITTAYRDLWRGPEHPSPASLRWAARLGWATAAAWDDDRIDDPRARPSGAGRPAKRLRGQELVDHILDAAQCGHSWEATARHLGYLDPRSLERRLYRYGVMTDVAAAFPERTAA